MRGLVLPSLFAVAAAQPAEQPAENPIKKVVRLLGEMQSTMEKEADADKKSYSAMECWCRQNRDEKSQAVKNAQKKIKQLEGTIEGAIGTISTTTEMVKRLTKDIAEDMEELKTATDLRLKEKQEAEEDQGEYKETVRSLTKALDVLGKVAKPGAQASKTYASQADTEGSTSFLQLKRELSAPRFNGLLQKDMWDMLGSLHLEDSSKKAFLQQTSQKGSGEIYGILDQMKENFEGKLKDSLESEAAAEASFAKLKAAKNREIKAAKEAVASNQKKQGDAKMLKTNSETELKMTRDALSEDEQFLLKLEEDCKTADEGYAARSKERGDEIAAVGEAIAVLTSDESRDILSKTHPVFVQLMSKAHSIKQARNKAAKLILAQAKKSGNKMLAAVAVSVQLDAFTKVKAALDKLHAELKIEQKTEFETRDNCMKDIADNEAEQQDTSIVIEDTNTAIDDLTATIEQLTEEMAALNAEIKSSKEMLAKAGADRKEENAGFLTMVNDQKLTIEVLNKAMEKLESFYGKSALLQLKSSQPKQKTYEKNESAPGVIGLIQMIVADAQHVIKEGTKDEQRAQSNYESLVGDTNKSVNTAEKQVTQKTSEKAAAIQEKEQADLTLAQNVDIMGNLKKENKSLHNSCDFLLKNFDTRQAARLEEMEAIDQAKQVLSGADFGK